MFIANKSSKDVQILSFKYAGKKCLLAYPAHIGVGSKMSQPLSRARAHARAVLSVGGKRARDPAVAQFDDDDDVEKRCMTF